MLEKWNFSVDPKNIGFQSLEAFNSSLISQIEDLITRMRWKLFYAKEEERMKQRNGGFRVPLNTDSQSDNNKNSTA